MQLVSSRLTRQLQELQVTLDNGKTMRETMSEWISNEWISNEWISNESQLALCYQTEKRWLSSTVH